MGKTLTVAIDGMHCSGCETLFRDALEELEGVLNVRVSHKDGNAAVEKKGYVASVVDVADRGRSGRHSRCPSRSTGSA